MPSVFPLGQTVLFTDVVNPDANDDQISIGARRGYWWLNTATSSMHVCINASESAAVWREMASPGIFAELKTANHDILVTDFQKLFIASSGTLTFTLPTANTLPNGWWCQYRNRSGNTLSIVRSGSDTINSGATVVSVTTGTPIGQIVKLSSSSFEVA
jgi:hypothetical protein